MSVRWVCEDWTRHMAHLLLSRMLHQHPNATINPYYTTATQEGDSIILQVQIDLNSDMPRPSFWRRLTRRPH